MDQHTTWFDFIPFYGAAKHGLHDSLVRKWSWQVFQTTNFDLVHVMGALLVLVFLAFAASRYAVAVSGSGDAGLVPPPRLILRNLFEVLADTVLGLMAGVMGEKAAKRYLPLVGTLFFFILFSNLLGLIPGFEPPTGNFATTFGLGLVSFLAYNYYGLKENGLAYLAHLAGPKWYLAPLVFPIEVISTCVRPITLAVRLMINMAVDHLIDAIFLGMIALLVPIPLMFLGIIVILVQTLVFCLLTSIYIGLATEHAEHH